LRSSIDVENIFRGCPGRPKWRRHEVSIVLARPTKKRRR
jgi:predicted transcriptional regulator